MSKREEWWDERIILRDWLECRFVVNVFKEDVDDIFAEIVEPIVKQARLKERERVVEKIGRWKWRKYHIEHGWVCPQCRSYGEEGQYCPNDRRRLVEEKRKWESDKDEAYNQGVMDTLAQLKTKKK